MWGWCLVVSCRADAGAKSSGVWIVYGMDRRFRLQTQGIVGTDFILFPSSLRGSQQIERASTPSMSVGSSAAAGRNDPCSQGRVPAARWPCLAQQSRQPRCLTTLSRATPCSNGEPRGLSARNHSSSATKGRRLQWSRPAPPRPSPMTLHRPRASSVVFVHIVTWRCCGRGDDFPHSAAVG